MRSKWRKGLSWAGILAGGGIIISGPGTSCSSYVGQTALVAADFCFIFDCQNGALGGTFDPCSGIGSSDETIEGQVSPPLFTDCPVE